MKPITRLDITLAICSLLLAVLVTNPASAQVTTAAVVGTVTDSTGATVSGAKVQITNTGTRETRAADTGESGDFAFTFLQPGSYSVTVEASGFQKSRIDGITLAAGDRTRSDAKLQVGGTSQEIQVTSAVSALQTDSSTINTVVPEKIVQDVPLDGRNYIVLVQHALGVTPGSANGTASGTRPDDRRQTNSVQSNGQSENTNNNLVDGMDNNERNAGLIILRPSIDSIQEVRVETNTPPAEVGRTTGAVINVITKAGTNGFHGTFFEFFRNDVLDANDFFAKRAGTPRYKLRQNQFGGSLGGPIRKDKTFFFADAEWLRIVQGQPSGLFTVPTLFEEQNPGNFSDQPGGQVLAPSQLDPAALKLWKLFPAPNVPSGNFANNYSNSPSKPFNSFTADSRIDHHFGNGDSAFVRYSYNDVSSLTPGWLPVVNGVAPGGGSYPGPNKTTAQGVQIHYLHLFSQNLVAEGGFGFARLNIATLPLNYGKNLDDSFGIPNGNINSTNASGLSPIVISGFSSGLGDSNYVPILDINNVFQGNGAITYTHGAHSIKTGAALIRRQMNFNQFPYSKGEFDFQYGTALLSSTQFLLGNASTIQRGNPLPNFFGLRMWEPSVYVQDDWRVMKGLTVNMGLRWDFFSPVIEAHNNRANFDLNTLSMVVATDKDRAAGVKPKYKNFAPRLGFAASPGYGFVVRGSFGMIFTPREATFALTPLNQPYYSLTSCNPGSTNTGLACPAGIGKISNGPILPTFGSINPLRGAVYGRALDYPTSYIQQWNLTLQKEFGQTIITAAYIGNGGRHLSYSLLPDNPDPAPGPLPAYRYAAQFPLVNKIQLYTATAVANYNAGQFSVERRYSKNLTVNGNFTWAHGLSNGGGAWYGHNQYDYGSYGTAYNFNLLGVYNIPFFNTMTGIGKAALAGWSLNATAYWRAGAYFTVMNTAHNPALINIPGQTSDRPNRLPYVDIKAGRSRSQWFNINAFREQPQGTVGNEGPNILRGPDTRQVDMSLAKAFTFHERVNFQFRAEAFNVTNTVNFAVPNSNISKWDPNTGLPTTNGSPGVLSSTILGVSPRVYQFALKGTF